MLNKWLSSGDGNNCRRSERVLCCSLDYLTDENGFMLIKKRKDLMVNLRMLKL